MSTDAMSVSPAHAKPATGIFPGPNVAPSSRCRDERLHDQAGERRHVLGIDGGAWRHALHRIAIAGRHPEAVGRPWRDVQRGQPLHRIRAFPSGHDGAKRKAVDGEESAGRSSRTRSSCRGASPCPSAPGARTRASCRAAGRAPCMSTKRAELFAPAFLSTSDSRAPVHRAVPTAPFFHWMPATAGFEERTAVAGALERHGDGDRRQRLAGRSRSTTAAW